jgi:hypothetical protein
MANTCDVQVNLDHRLTRKHLIFSGQQRIMARHKPLQDGDSRFRPTEDVERWIQELSELEAANFLASMPDANHSQRELATRFATDLRAQAARVLPISDAIQDHPAFEKLVELGCESVRLTLLLCLAVNVPKRATPEWKNLLPISERKWQTYAKRIAELARDIQAFLTRGGLDIVPSDLHTGLDLLPLLLLQYSVVIEHVHAATSKHIIYGPQGIDGNALIRLARYILDRTGEARGTQVVALMQKASAGKIQLDPSVYSKFVKRHLS